MIGRSPLAAAIAAIVLTGCATFTDDDIAARVDDVELSEDELAVMLRDLAGDDDADVAPMSDVNQILNDFVLDRALRSDLAAGGTLIADNTDEITLVTLQESIGQSFATWQTATPTAVAPDQVRATYDLGLAESNMACTAHILVDDEATAREVLDRLAGGDDFGELAGEYSIESGAGARGGALPCDTTGNFTQQYIPEFVEAALDAEVGRPVGPVETQFGYHVITVRPFDDLADGELEPVLANPAVRFGFAVADLDIYVNPRYGSFDVQRGVVPLG